MPTNALIPPLQQDKERKWDEKARGEIAYQLLSQANQTWNGED